MVVFLLLVIYYENSIIIIYAKDYFTGTDNPRPKI